MKPCTVFALVLTLHLPVAFAQVPDVINYQGRLLNGSGLVNGPVAMKLNLYTNESDVVPVYQDTGLVTVVDGLYSTFLGDGTTLGSLPDAVAASNLYLEVVVDDVPLIPRERVAAVAYALVAGGVPPGAITLQMLADDSVSSAKIVDGTITNTDLAVGSVDSGNLVDASVSESDLAADSVNGGKVADGTLTGADLADGSISNADVAANTFWGTYGNTGTSPDTNYLGTTDNTPFEIRVYDRRAFRIVPIGFLAPNIVGGFRDNYIVGSIGSVIAGGGGENQTSPNTIDADSKFDAIGGGTGNKITNETAYCTIAGGDFNAIRGGRSCTIGGGTANAIYTNTFYCTIPGGVQNWIQDNVQYGTIGGGFKNVITDGRDHGTIAGGVSNTVGGVGGTIGGGANNTANADYATIAGGSHNDVSNDYATVGGGQYNIVDEPGGTIGGGEYNQVVNDYGFIGGGVSNECGLFAVVGGGYHNLANVSYATVPGGKDNEASSTYTFAAGKDAKAIHQGSFVWSDDSGGDFESFAAETFNVRATGGVHLSIETSVYCGDATRQMLNLYSNTYGIGVQSHTLYFRSNDEYSWYKGGDHSDTENDPGTGGAELMRLEDTGLTVNGVFVSASDRNLKQDFESVDPQEVLEKVAALPVEQWSYRRDEAGSRHLGPMAQDFYAAFGLGADDRHIATVDADGVALAAIQGLNRKLVEEVNRLTEMNAELQRRLATIERQMDGQPPAFD